MIDDKRARHLMAEYPLIPWRQPMPVPTDHGEILVCRLCAVLYGKRLDVKAAMVRSADEFRHHLWKAHAIQEAA